MCFVVFGEALNVRVLCVGGQKSHNCPENDEDEHNTRRLCERDSSDRLVGFFPTEMLHNEWRVQSLTGEGQCEACTLVSEWTEAMPPLLAKGSVTCALYEI